MHRRQRTRLAGAAITSAALALATIAPASADVANGDFSAGLDGGWWSTANLPVDVVDGALCGDVPAGTSNPWDAIVGQDGLDLPAGDYVFTFAASGTGPVKGIVQDPVTYAEAASVTSAVAGADGFVTHEVAFTVEEETDDLQLAFQVGGSADAWTFCADDVAVTPAGTELLATTTFEDGTAPWFVSDPSLPNDVVDGSWCIEVPGGTEDPWDVIVGYNDLTLAPGDYALAYEGTGAGPVRALVGLQVDPYTVYGETSGMPGATSFSVSDAGGDRTQTQVAFQIGGAAEPWTFCLDSVSLLSGTTPEPYVPETGPRVRVNQVGYLAQGPKRATVVTDAADALTWSLVDGSGDTAAEGTTVPTGLDPSSDQAVHTIDFSEVSVPGTYTLTADGETSYPFEIGTDAYESLRTDALNYFYLARSGIEIDAEIVGADYARPAGHVSAAGGPDTNQGDRDVACQPVEESVAVYGEPWTCDYTLDVVGGWYDAGDHGKYVVNGGIATAQLLQTYERTKTAASTDAGALEDGTLAVPETGNAVPDVLDEARWELEFMQSMMVPDGEELAGMAHHKVHDYGWTGLPLLPHRDGQTRYLHRPSTAATLNLAATAAQGARLFAPYDGEYAAALLDDARTAWSAALEHPDLFAPAADGNNGGGPYDDDDVSDEFVWAAAELFLTTGEQAFEGYLLEHDDVLATSVDVEGFSWGSVGALAVMDLATVPNDYAGRDDVVATLLAGADEIAAVQADQAYGMTYAGAEDGTWVWGSNSSVLNTMVVLGAAYDVSGDDAYRDAVVESADYLLGRNALNLSYVTGYGDVYSQNQHSRWFSAQLNAELPHPPAGSVAGGPNSDSPTWDPTLAALMTDGCAPQFCYVDDIQSWASNEITVNWNSALSWVASFLADQDQGAPTAEPSCAVEFIEHGTWPGGSTNQIWVTNTGTSPLTWSRLMWSWSADQSVTRQAWSAGWSQEASHVTAQSMSWNATIRPGQRVTIGFVGDPGSLASATPEQFWLDGAPCSTS
ncbi:glycoside hydrolase family 9 protein [Paraoerskovia marina]|uniref:glycoside hydrolase family 9 protein n=1 Tax=Paraoerskovia marina TaxID=545619 RepID=UPI000A72716E|nr:glycoside hydrolase family 9 protein [Paraoerskovia marina]